VSICIRPSRDLNQREVARLGRAMEEFYATSPSEYYAAADAALDKYSPSTTPFHWDLLSRIPTGASILELGCGTAHLCPRVLEKGCTYTGLDFGDKLLKGNRERHPTASFYRLAEQPSGTFDVVASLYTIEHVVDPIAYLERMWDLCSPGGLLALICPELIDTDSLPPSLVFGFTTRRLREKVASGRILDALEHVLDLRFRAPKWQQMAKMNPPGSFWINLKPRILHGSAYSIDADAVHLVRLRDLEWWFSRRGAQIITTSRDLSGISPEILRFNCYILVRKPGPGMPGENGDLPCRGA